jgi:hypothetical protein
LFWQLRLAAGIADHVVPAGSFIDEMLDSRKLSLKQMRRFRSQVYVNVEADMVDEMRDESAQRDVLAHGGPRDGLIEMKEERSPCRVGQYASDEAGLQGWHGCVFWLTIELTFVFHESDVMRRSRPGIVCVFIGREDNGLYLFKQSRFSQNHTALLPRRDGRGSNAGWG